jgi:hypothetical protein
MYLNELKNPNYALCQHQRGFKMADSWTKVFDDTVDERPVTGEVYDEGGYKVRITQKSDYEGNVSKDESGTIIMPPSEGGSVIEIEANSLDELEQDLVNDGEFTAEQARNIAENFRT